MRGFNERELSLSTQLASVGEFAEKYCKQSRIYKYKMFSKNKCEISIKTDMELLSAQPIAYISQFYVKGMYHR